MKFLSLAFVALAVSGYAEAATYSRTASLSGQSFLDAFSWQAIEDPTHGRVNYVSKSTAQSAGLYSVSQNAVTLRADDTTILNPAGPGRNSFRLMSNSQYTNHVAIFDIGHMPQGCGTWPAVCKLLLFVCLDIRSAQEVGPDWPNQVGPHAYPSSVRLTISAQGEIDIVEGVNDVTPNQSTLHTSASRCFNDRINVLLLILLQISVGNNCNAGCGVQLADGNSFGPNFNGGKGGWYAIERSSTYISIYFWERGSSSVPSQVKNPGGTVDTSTWGIPGASFPNTDCDFPSHFGSMNIIINLTFCGDWADAVYWKSGCPSTCVDYVNNNPQAFSNAYFEFNSLNIYE
ncbi:2 beta-glucan [Lanmaoa asiatica]|nr:2 beta-glucan [Lanmaoa asiatica]